MTQEELCEVAIKRRRDIQTLLPFQYCEMTRGNCFICSGVHCIGLAERIKNNFFWENYSNENS